MMTTIKAESNGYGGYRAEVVQPTGVPPMVGAQGETIAEAVRGMCVVLGYRGDFAPINHTYRDGSHGHLPVGVSLDD